MVIVAVIWVLVVSFRNERENQRFNEQYNHLVLEVEQLRAIAGQAGRQTSWRAET